MTNKRPVFFTAVLVTAMYACTAMAVTPADTNAPAAKPAAKTEAPLFDDPVIAKADGIVVKRSQLDATMVSVRASVASRSAQPIPPAQMQMIEQQVLDRLVQIQILLKKATDADKAKGKENSDKRIDMIIKRAGSDEALTRQLKSIGLTQEELRAKILEEATAEAVMDRELNITVKDEDAKKFYADHPSEFEQPEMARVSHILIATADMTTGKPLPDAQKQAKRKIAEEALKKAKAGGDFAKLVKEYSDDTSTKDKGGEITFPRGQAGPPEFEAAAFALNTNQISDIVTTAYGYHIIKLLEKTPTQKMEYSKIEENLKEQLKNRDLQKVLPEYMKNLKKNHHVEILDEKLKMPEFTEDFSPAGATPAPSVIQ